MDQDDGLGDRQPMNDRGMSDVCPGSALAARPQLAQREQSIIIIIVRLTLLRSLNALTIDDHRRLVVCTRVVYEVKSKWSGCVLLSCLPLVSCGAGRARLIELIPCGLACKQARQRRTGAGV